jgi:hypothetical protein
MINLIKKYKAFLIGLVILLILKEILIYYKVILIDPSESLENILGFMIWWMIISLPIYYFGYLKKHRMFIFRLAGLMAFMVLVLALDSQMKIPDNPVSVFSLLVFWLGIFYLLMREFFMKYRRFIFGFYAATFCYFLLTRIFYGQGEVYEKHKEIFFVLFFVPIPVLILLWIYEQWKWLKNLKEEKAKAELSMLKSQVNPHFFFNTLNNLYSLTVRHSDKAPEVILKLSDMMRYTIYEGQKDRVPLREEIAYLENYISLHKIRHHKTVDIEFVYETGSGVMVAPLLFIILLENAFKHGVEKLTEKAWIKISLMGTEKEVSFTIENNFDPTETPEQAGIGLENLKRRLSLIYPARHELKTEERDGVYRVGLRVF